MWFLWSVLYAIENALNANFSRRFRVEVIVDLTNTTSHNVCITKKL